MAEQKFDITPIDSAWRSLCKLLFGRDAGGLEKFKPYLLEAMMPYMIVKSGVSGKPVYFSNPLYPKNGKFVSSEELGGIKQKKISINDIKDIDSLFRAAEENTVYCGNKVFGKNVNIELADNALDCIDVYHAHNVRNVKKGAYISYVRESECVFGVPAFPKINYAIRCHEGINVNRMFESFYITHSSDMYYSSNCTNCADVIFGFNLRGKRHVIGNVQLEQGKYLALKKKLVSEIADELEKKGRARSFSDIARMAAKEADTEGDVKFIPTLPAPKGVEKAFSETANIVLGKTRAPISDFVPYLQSRTLPIMKVKGKFGTPTFNTGIPLVKGIPPGCLCTLSEALAQNQPLLSDSEVSLPLEKMAIAVSGKAAFTLDFVDGACRDNVDVSQVIDSTDVYSCWDTTTTTRSACSDGVIQSKYIFGCSFRQLDSEFCIKCCDIMEAKRCFEVDSSSRSVNCYFCHNVEGCEECILCSNVKGKRYAVLNQEVGREEYLRVKKMLLDYVNSELDRKRSVAKSIFAL